MCARTPGRALVPVCGEAVWTEREREEEEEEEEEEEKKERRSARVGRTVWPPAEDEKVRN